MYNVVTGYEIGFIHDYPTIYIYIFMHSNVSYFRINK